MRSIIENSRPSEVLFIFENEEENMPADEELEKLFSADTFFFMPKFSKVAVKAAEFDAIKQKAVSYGTALLEVSNPGLVLMKENMLTFANKRLIYFKALAYNKLVRVSEISWAASTFVNSLLVGMILPTILTYAANIGVLNIYNLVLEVIEASVIIIACTFATNRVVNIQMMRADNRTDMIKGHIWEKKIQNEKGVKRLSKYFIYNAVLNVVSCLLFFALVPASIYGKMQFGGLLFSLVPTVYLAIFLGQNILYLVLSNLEGFYLTEITEGAILSNEDSIKKGFAKQNKNIENYSQIMRGVIGGGGMLLGIGFLKLGLNDAIVPTILISSVISMMSGFIIPLFSGDSSVGLEFNTRSFLGSKNENELRAGKNITLSFKPDDPRITNVMPVPLGKNRSWLPWAKMLKTTLTYSVKPKIKKIANRIEISGDKEDPLITVRKRSGIMKNPEDVLSLEPAGDSWVVSFAPEKKGARGSLSGVNIWRAVGNVLISRFGADNPIAGEIINYASSRSKEAIDHGLAVEAFTALGGNITPDTELTEAVFSQPLLTKLKGKVVIDMMNGPPLKLAVNKSRKIKEEKIVWFSKDENSVLHVVLPQQFKEEYSDKIIPAATLAVIHEYLEATGKTHSEVVDLGFGSELLSYPENALQKTIKKNLEELDRENNPAYNVSAEYGIPAETFNRIKKFQNNDFSYLRLIRKVRALLDYDGPSKELVHDKVVKDIYKMSEACKREQAAQRCVGDFRGHFASIRNSCCPRFRAEKRQFWQT